MRWIVGHLVALGVLSLGAPGVQAQGPPEDPAGGPGPAAAEQRPHNWRAARRQEIRRKIEVIRIARLTDELDLDPETAARLVPVLSRFDQADKRHRQYREELGRDLRRLVEEGAADAAQLNAAIDRWWDHEEAAVRERRELFRSLEGTLTPEQRVRFMLFVPRFEREVRRLVRDMARERFGAEGRARWHERDDRPDRRRRPRPWGTEGGPGWPGPDAFAPPGPDS